MLFSIPEIEHVGNINFLVTRLELPGAEPSRAFLAGLGMLSWCLLQFWLLFLRNLLPGLHSRLCLLLAALVYLRTKILQLAL